MPHMVPALPAELRAQRQALSRLIAENGAAAIANFGIDWLAVLDAYDEDGQTPLYEAVVLEHVAAVRALVELGANPRRVQCFTWAVDAREVTPLNAALRTCVPGALIDAMCPAGALARPTSSASWDAGEIHWKALRCIPGSDLLEAAIEGRIGPR